jgi:hypothetical protein
VNVTASHVAVLVGALLLDAVAHQLIQAEGAALGLRLLELSLLTAAAGIFCQPRTAPRRSLIEETRGKSRA